MSYFRGAAAGVCGLVIATAGSYATYQCLEEGFDIGGMLFGIKNSSGADRKGNAPQLQVMLSSDSDEETNVIDLNNPSAPEQKDSIAAPAATGESALETKEKGKGKRSASRNGRGGRNKAKRTKESGGAEEEVVVGTDEDAAKKTIIVAEKTAVEEKQKPKEEPTDGKVAVVGAPEIGSVQEVVSVSDKTDLKQSPNLRDGGNHRTQLSVPREQGASETIATTPANPVLPKPQPTKPAAKSKSAARPQQRSRSFGVGRWGLVPTLPYTFLMVSRDSWS